MFPGRHRDWLSKMSGMSKSKIARLEAICRNLATSLIDDFNAGCLSVTTAYRLSQETPEIQMALARMAPAQVLSALNDRELEDQINRCKAPRQDPPIKTKPDGNGYDVDAYLENRCKEDDDFFEMLNDVAKEFIRTLGAVNSRSEGIETLKSEFGRTCFGHSSSGDGASFTSTPKGLTLYRRDVPQIFRTWTEVYDMLCTIALNRAATGSGWEDDVEPAPVSGMDTAPDWQSGDPTREGVYWCKFLINGQLLTRAARWYDDNWHFNNIETDIRASCIGWWPLPEEA